MSEPEFIESESNGRAFKPQLEPSAKRLLEVGDKTIDMAIKDLRVYLIGKDSDVNFLKGIFR
jgi:hypothetical protein